MGGTNGNSTAIAGEFAVLSRLLIEGYDASLTLGNTKSVDILVSHDGPKGRMAKLEVKTNRGKGNSGGNRKLFGDFVFSWVMHKNHESIVDPNLFYCFVNISETKAKTCRFFILPSKVVARYVRKQHEVFLSSKPRPDTSPIRMFRIGDKSFSYPFKTPLINEYEDAWDFAK